MEFGVHLPLISISGEQQPLDALLSFTEAARDLGYTHLCANDHLVFAPRLDGPTALAAASPSTTRSRNACSSAQRPQEDACATTRASASSFSALSCVDPRGGTSKFLDRPKLRIDVARPALGVGRGPGRCSGLPADRCDAIRGPWNMEAAVPPPPRVLPRLRRPVPGSVVPRRATVGNARNALQPGPVPSSDPDRWTRAMLRCWGQLEASGGIERTLKCNIVDSPERAQRLHRLVEPLPRSWNNTTTQLCPTANLVPARPAVGRGGQVDRCVDLASPGFQNTGSQRWSPRHLTAVREHGGQRGQPVEPRYSRTGRSRKAAVPR